MAKENDINHLFYREFPDLKWSQRSNVAADVREVETGDFDFETFIDGLSDNASDLPALKLRDGRTLAIDDVYDDRDELKEEVKRHIAEYLRAADAYERELRGLTRHALQQASIDARAKDAERKNRVRRKREGNLPFSSPEAQADVTRWARLAPWTPEQAVALSYAKDPEIVNSKQLLLAPASSPFLSEYQRRLEQLHRAIGAGIVKNPLTLADFRVWSQNAGIDLPDELEGMLTLGDIDLDGPPERIASQSRKNNHLLRMSAALINRHLGIDMNAMEKHIITNDQAKDFEVILGEIQIYEPKEAIIRKHLQAAIDLVYKERSDRRRSGKIR